MTITINVSDHVYSKPRFDQEKHDQLLQIVRDLDKEFSKKPIEPHKPIGTALSYLSARMLFIESKGAKEAKAYTYKWKQYNHCFIIYVSASGFHADDPFKS